MDAWGYHFILGSAAAWFAQDAEDAIRWLRSQKTLETLGIERPPLAGEPGLM